MQTPVSMDIRENKAYIEAACADCVDIIRQEVRFGIGLRPVPAPVQQRV